MEVKVFDDYLPIDQFQFLKDLFLWKTDIPWVLCPEVAHRSENIDEYWNWYAIHPIYGYPENDTISPHTPCFSSLNNIFFEEFRDQGIMRSLIRAKANFYPGTDKVYEHDPHTDYPWSHTAAIFSLNTCDGFTKVGDEKVESVANRLLLFDGSKPHNSSTCTNAKGRYNLSFNFL